MKKKILIIKNCSHEAPGLFESILKERKISYDIIDLSINEDLPLFEGYSACVVLGGPDSANDNSNKINSEIEFIKQIIKSKTPFLGICLGLQLLVKALKGKVVKSQTKELGFRGNGGEFNNISLTTDGKTDKLLLGINAPFPAFHLHGETVELTKEFKTLASSTFVENQIIKYGTNTYGIQFHLELTKEMFELWLAKDKELLAMDINLLRKDFKSISNEYEKTGSLLFNNFISVI